MARLASAAAHARVRARVRTPVETPPRYLPPLAHRPAQRQPVDVVWLLHLRPAKLNRLGG